MIKKIGKILGIFLLIILMLMVAIPYFYQDKIAKVIKEEVNKQLDANVDFEGVSISLFKDFPNVSANIKNMTVTGNAPFEGVHLYKANNTYLSLDIFSIINSNNPYVLNRILLDNPNINIKINEQGKANYDITKSDESAATNNETGAFHIELNKYELKNGDISFNDLQGNTYVGLSGFNHSGSGDFSQDLYKLSTKTNIKNTNLRMGGVHYLKRANINAEIDIKVDQTKSSYSIDKNKMQINGLSLENEGSIVMLDEGVNLDIDFKAPGNSFKEILSLIPGVYSKSFDGLQAEGVSHFEGSIHGLYGQDKYPALQLHCKLNDGTIQYPDFPKPIKNVNVEINIESKSSDLSDMLVDVPNFNLNMDGKPLTGRLRLQDPLGKPNINGLLNGDVDLGLIQQIAPLEGIESMEGVLSSNIEIKANYHDIEQSNYEAIQFNGALSSDKLHIKYEDQPDIHVSNIELRANPKQIDIPNTSLTAGKSDINIQGSIREPLAYLTQKNQTIIDLNLKSELLDINEWASDDANSEDDASKNNDAGSDSDVERMVLNYKADIQRLKYEDYDIRQIASRGKIKANDINIDSYSMLMDGSKMKASGQIKNAYDYLYNSEPAKGNMNIYVDQIDLNKYLEEETASENHQGGETEIVRIPKDLIIDFVLEAGKIIYQDYILNNAKSRIELKDEKADLAYFTGGTLGGQFDLKGSYNSKNLEKPVFDFSYDLERMDFQQLFKTSLSARRLAPILEYIQGRFNSDMSISGNFGPDMVPEFTDVTANGFLQTLEGAIKGFLPLDQIAQKLGLEDLRSFEIKDSKNWFEIKNGAVEIEETAFTKQDMNFKASGKHFIDNTMDYLIKAEIPRDKIGENIVSQSMDVGINWLESQAKKVGVNVDVGDLVYFDIKIKGSFKDPKVSIVPTGSGGKSLKSSAEDKAKEVLNEAKEKAMDKAKKEVDKKKEEVTKKVEKKVDEIAEKTKEEAKKKVDEGIKKGKKAIGDKAKDVIGDQVGDQLGDKAKEAIDEVIDGKAKEKVDETIDKLKDINPFKKKKKNG